MAEREGFEPSKRFPVYTLSKRAPSTRPSRIIDWCAVFFEEIGNRNTSRDEMLENLINALIKNGWKMTDKKK